MKVTTHFVVSVEMRSRLREISRRTRVPQCCYVADAVNTVLAYDEREQLPWAPKPGRFAVGVVTRLPKERYGELKDMCLWRRCGIGDAMRAGLMAVLEMVEADLVLDGAPVLRAVAS